MRANEYITVAGQRCKVVVRPIMTSDKHTADVQLD